MGNELIDALEEYLKHPSCDGNINRPRLRKALKSQIAVFLEKRLKQDLAKSIIYMALRDTKSYLKTMEIQGHVPLLSPHNKIMAEIESALEQRKDLFP